MLGNETQRGEGSSARSVILEEKEPDVQCIEQSLGNILVAALGVPMPAAVAPAEMHPNVQAFRSCVQHPIGNCNIGVYQTAPVVAARRQGRPDIRISKF